MNSILAKLAGANRGNDQVVQDLVGVVDKQAAEVSTNRTR